eukprot:Skav230337  [mRNA]  locus=scaffold920:102804:109101:- [translate_table: standard]
MAQWDNRVQASSLTGGRWSEQTTSSKYSMLTGFLQIPEKEAEYLLKHSGKRGIFVSIQEATPVKKAITWMQRDKNEEPDVYLQRCLQEGQSRTQSLYFRKSGTQHNIGLPATAEEAAKARSVQYVLRGSPHDWFQDEIVTFLLSQKWTGIQALHKQRFNRDWRFNAIAPNKEQEAYNYEPQAAGETAAWQPPDLKTLAGAILDANGAAGCDSWSSTETKFLPFEAIQHFHQLTLRWHAAKQVPAVFSYSRQANLPKTQKIEQGCFKASHTRPITVFSIFYRAWASAWTRTEQFKAFAEALPAEIAGVYNHDGSEAAASFLQQQLVITKGVCVSLDYSQCYDRLRIPLTTQFLEKIGWPHQVIAILQQVWPTQRHIEFDKHVHPHTLTGSGVPQGCPFAPMALACVMTSGHNSVSEILQSDFCHSQEETQQSDTKIYMDDRSFVDQNYQRCLDRAAAWHQWSHTVGLLENTGKAQALAKTKALHQKLVSDRPQWVQEKTMKVLGCSLRSQPAKNTTEEDQRITTAINRSKLLGCLPVSFKQKLELYKVFVMPKAMYGWISRFPTKTTANTLINNLTRISGGQRLANPVIRSVVYGGSTHAHPVMAVRMLQRFGRMRQANTIVWSNQPGTPTHALRKWLQEFEWEEVAPWQWKHGDQPMSLQAGTDCSIPAHQVRHAWRHVLLKQWSRGPRHEAALFQRRTSPLQMRAELQDIDLEATRKALEVTSANGRAIMLGSAVSPAMLQKMMPGKSPACPWCACPMATFEHLAWQCRGFPEMAARPEKPSNFLSWRFAWPTWTMSKSQHKRLLSWLASIQEQLLLLRYNSSG